MGAYTAVEEREPDLVMIEDGFRRVPEFKTFEALLQMLSIRRIVVLEKPTGATSNDPRLGFVSAIEEPARIAAFVAAKLQDDPKTFATPKGHDGQTLRKREPLLLIGASTGGVEALTTILGEFPTDCMPTLIVQHTGQGFGSGLANLLDKVCPAHVLKAHPRMQLERGTVYLAAGGTQHLVLSKTDPGTAELVHGEKVAGHIPSIDVLFESATNHAKFCIAGLLTGMGKDGTEGLHTLRNAGARTFSQDAESSVVYGMPKVAWDIGAAEEQIPLEDVAQHVVRLAAQLETGDFKRGV